MEKLNYLLGYPDMYIYQDSEWFNFSLDSVLLPNFITINKNIERILDIGCGNAPIPLILSTKTDAKIIGVEIQKNVYNLACESININNKNDQIKIINEDINDLYKKMDVCSFDVITCNPPYFNTESDNHKNDSIYKTIARHEIYLNLDQLFNISKVLLKTNGVLGIVHRPDRLVEILEKMKANNIEPKKIQFIYPKNEKEANILLVEGRKNGRPGLKILPPLYTHNNNGEYTDEIKRYFIN